MHKELRGFCHVIRQYHLQKIAALTMTCCAINIVYPLIPAAHAQEVEQIDDTHGVIQVHGELNENTCRLEMMSAWQDIDLGKVTSAQLHNIGDRGTPVVVQLKLLDCPYSSARFRDENSGNLTRGVGQPAVSIRFTAPAEDGDPSLIKVWGTRGLGLRLVDAKGRVITLGNALAPLLLEPGQNALFYKVIPERTSADLQAGAYRAQINFWLNYD